MLNEWGNWYVCVSKMWLVLKSERSLVIWLQIYLMDGLAPLPQVTCSWWVWPLLTWWWPSIPIHWSSMPSSTMDGHWVTRSAWWEPPFWTVSEGELSNWNSLTLTSSCLFFFSCLFQVSGFLMGLSVIGSIFNITGIAVNRYCYICHSFSYSRLYSYRNTLLFVALIWVLTVVAIIPNFFVGSLRYDPRVYSCTFAQNVSSSYTVAVVVVHFLVPIAVVTFCYLRIWVLVIQVSLPASSQTAGLVDS